MNQIRNDEFFPDSGTTVQVLQPPPISLPATVAKKTQFEELAAMLNSALLEENSALEAYVRIKNVSEILDVALAQIREQALSAINGTSEPVLGAVVQLKALPKRWEYDDCEIRTLEAQKAGIDTRLKARKKFLETLKEEVVDTATGELIRPARCVSEGVTLQVTF
jgi:hypothetical protein